MPRTLIGSILIACLAITLPGCSSMNRQEKGAAIGAGAGAGLGALIGAATGSWAWGAVIGAGAGALGGYVIADITEEDEPYTGSVSQTQRQEAEDYVRRANQSTSAEESERLLLRSIEIHPTPAAHNNLGILYLQKGNRSAAESEWRRALALDPDYRAARDNLNRSQAG
jgi:tetratricopeptide (TPR) repeat protein